MSANITERRFAEKTGTYTEEPCRTQGGEADQEKEPMKVTPLTLEQGSILTGYTGNIFAPLSDFHTDVERRAGRPFFTHELADPHRMESVRKLYADDFEELMSVMTLRQ